MRKPKIDISKTRILIVENHELIRRILHKMLRGFGVQHMVQARNVSEGLVLIYTEHFDIVILDFFLGQRNGADIVRRCARWCRQGSSSIPTRARPCPHHMLARCRGSFRVHLERAHLQWLRQARAVR